MLDYAYFKENYRLIAADVSKQKALDTDPRAIQQIIFQGVAGEADNTKMKLYTILEKIERNGVRILQSSSKSSVNNINTVK